MPSERTHLTAQDSVLRNLRDAIHDYFLPHRHTALLVAIVTALAVRPLLGDTGAGPLVFSIALLVLVLASLYIIQTGELVGERKTLHGERRRLTIIGWALALPALVERLAIIFVPDPTLYLTGAICWLLLFVFITWNQLRAVLRQKKISRETISASISIYLLLGLTWGLFYILLNHVQPHAFSFAGSPMPMSGPSSEQETYPVLIYFSLTTLSTIGFGDIVPMTLQARYAAVAEGITGQFYLAILVARLVGMQMSQSASQQVESTTHDQGLRE